MKRAFWSDGSRLNGAAAVRRATVCVLLFLITGCNESNPTASASASGTKVTINGSNTVGEELAPRLIAEYKKEHPGIAFDLQSKATGYGLAALMAGKCDIAAASRVPIKGELEIAQTRGIQLNDHVIGVYSVAVIVNSASPVANLTREQVRDIFTGVIQNWKDVGGPDGAIHLCVRDPISGTYLGFRELAMENKDYAANPKTFTSYALIAEAVGQDANAIGYSSIEPTYPPGVKTVSVGGVTPTGATVTAGQYPYCRTLHLYTNKGSEAPSAMEFVQFVTSARGQDIVAQMGFVRHR
jgi:phosphate transport system substrate-binding protein